MNPFDKAALLLDQINNDKVNNAEELEAYRINYLGTKNVLKDLFVLMKDLSVDDKKVFGQTMNTLKARAEERFEDLKIANTSTTNKVESLADNTLPGVAMQAGSRHPLMIVRSEIIAIFQRLGFTIADGPEIEDDWHNFGALNMPDDHSARDMQDTFYISTEPNIVLRTHTSSVQVRTMESQVPPIRSVFPGRVYRNETISARAHCFFHQIEGLYIDEEVSFADLKQTLYYFVKEFFGDVEVRFRPSYFPFTEPSAEMDISCLICSGSGCPVCKQTGWVEILGCGMVDPQVLTNCNIDNDKYSGFAFGMGVERITMLKYKINDLRLFSENDIRFLKQFSSL
jgi:phenylalanyl-tRNA synthetase alpha chain